MPDDHDLNKNDHDQTTPSRALEGLADAGTANTAHGRSLTAAESLEDWIVREARAISGPRTHLQDSEAVIQFGLRVAQRVIARNETQSWAVTVERNGESVVTLSSNMLAGRDLSDEDERVIRMAGEHLLAFIGRAAVPVEEAAPLTIGTVIDVHCGQRNFHAELPASDYERVAAGAVRDPVGPKPCPLCGGKAYATRTVNGTQMFHVGCASCGLELKAAWYRDQDQPTKDILTLWNTRLVAGAVPAPAARCDHKFIDSTFCLKCGWTPEART